MLYYGRIDICEDIGVHQKTGALFVTMGGFSIKGLSFRK